MPTPPPILELWRAPCGAGAPVGALVLAREVDVPFLGRECISRFLGTDNPPETRQVPREKLIIIAQRVTNGCVEHPDVYLHQVGPDSSPLYANVILLVWRDLARLVVTSAPITETSYQKSVQSHDWVDVAPHDTSQIETLRLSVPFFESILSAVSEQECKDIHLPVLHEVTDMMQRWGVVSAPSSVDCSVVPVFLSTGKGRAILSRAAAMWRSPHPATELYVSSATSPSKEHLLSLIGESLSLRNLGDLKNIVLVGVEVDHLREHPSASSIIRERYGDQPLLELFNPKLDEGARLEENTVIISNDHWLLRIVGSTSGLSTTQDDGIHALMFRSVDCIRHPLSEALVLSSLIETAAVDEPSQ
jgi:hypothetical protein